MLQAGRLDGSRLKTGLLQTSRLEGERWKVGLFLTGRLEGGRLDTRMLHTGRLEARRLDNYVNDTYIQVSERRFEENELETGKQRRERKEN